MRGFQEGVVHFGRHKGAALIAHILIKPYSVRIAFTLKEDFLQLNNQTRVGHRHIQHPVRVQNHPHQRVLMPAHANHTLKDIQTGPEEKTPVLTALVAYLAVMLEINAAHIGNQMRFDLAFPPLAFLNMEIHVLRRGIVMLVLFEHSAVSIQKGNGIFRFLHNLLFKIQVRHHFKTKGFIHVKLEMSCHALAC